MLTIMSTIHDNRRPDGELMTKRLLLLIGLAFAVVAAHAQQFPSKPVRIMVRRSLQLLVHRLVRRVSRPAAKQPSMR